VAKKKKEQPKNNLVAKPPLPQTGAKFQPKPNKVVKSNMFNRGNARGR
jgi:hypothetical protein